MFVIRALALGFTLWVIVCICFGSLFGKGDYEKYMRKNIAKWTFGIAVFNEVVRLFGFGD